MPERSRARAPTGWLEEVGLTEMTYYQTTQLQLAALDILLVIGLLSWLLITRRKAIPPVVILAVLVGLIGAFFFMVSYFTADQNLPRIAQVSIKLLRDLPIVLIVCYVSLLQARRYTLARRSGRLRRWFGRSPYVIGAGYLTSGAVEFVVRPPVLDSGAALPATTLFSDALVLVPLAIYAGATAVVFFLAAWKRAEGVNPKVQNVCGAVALGGLAILALHTFAWRAGRVWLQERQIDPFVEQMSANQVVIVAVVALSVTLGLAVYCGEGESERVAGRFLGFVELMGGITARLVNAPISSARVKVPYEAMLRATDSDLLDLPPEDRRKAGTLFRAIAAHRGYRRGKESEEEPSENELLRALASFYESELEKPTFAEELDDLPRERMPSALRDLRSRATGNLEGAPSDRSPAPSDGFYEVLSVLREIEVSKDLAEFRGLESWALLACVALAETDILSAGERNAILANPEVDREVVDGYRLARYEIENSSGDVNKSDGQSGL